MKVTKRQLKRIIKEEKRKLLKEEYGMGKDSTTDMEILLGYLRGAADRAGYMHTAQRADPAYGGTFGGNESLDLAQALEDIYVAFGGVPTEVFK